MVTGCPKHGLASHLEGVILRIGEASVVERLARRSQTEAHQTNEVLSQDAQRAPVVAAVSCHLEIQVDILAGEL